MVKFHKYAQEHNAEHDTALEHALRRITDPSLSVPRAIERIGEAEQLLRDPAVKAETIFLSRSLLEESLKLLGRPDLLA
jgi:hypothetical protein